MGKLSKTERRNRIKRSIRMKMLGTQEKPRLSVFRSNRGIYAQLINDHKGETLASMSSIALGKKSINKEISKEVGAKLADIAKEKGVTSVIFDRNGYLYHGNVQALAEGAREGGLKF